jgi:hypothetical protein
MSVFVADDASSDTAAATGGSTVVLNTFSKIWVTGDDKGPAKIGKNTGAGIMDASFAWDSVAYATDNSKVTIATVYTRSDGQQNLIGSYMQGGFALATLTDKGVVPGPEIALPQLSGERNFMRPLVGFTKKHVVLIAASEDNGVSVNPQPVMFIADKETGKLVEIPNSTRGKQTSSGPLAGLPGGIGEGGINKPTNLIQQAQKDGIRIVDPLSQRGPHTIRQVNENTFVVGMQYNNHAQEAFSVTVNDDASVKMNWLERYSIFSQHCRPQVAIEPGAKTGYIAAVEANNQPAEIGFRVTEFDVATGKAIKSEIPVRSNPQNNQFVSEPVLSILGDKLAITYGVSAKVRDKLVGGANGNNNLPANNLPKIPPPDDPTANLPDVPGVNLNGHAGGQSVDAAVLLDKATLKVIGAPMIGVGQYGRHSSSFVTAYGPNAEPALASISGSSTGTGGGFIQMYPLKFDGTLGLKDLAKVYQVSAFSDVANVQARGKRNPNNQARGFINGIGNVPNPGYTTDPVKAQTSFMPEVKQFSVSTVTGYSGPDALAKGQKNSVWLSLVPAAWRDDLTTIPGTATDKPGTNDDGTGPLPRTTGPGTNPSGDATTSEAEAAEAARRQPGLVQTDNGCSVATHGSTSKLGLAGLAVASVALTRRRKPRREA